MHSMYKFPSVYSEPNDSEQQIIDFLDGKWDCFMQTIGDSLFSMNSTDFDSTCGLNECGFKCMVITHIKTLMSLSSNDYHVHIESEKPIPSSKKGETWSFVDMMITHKKFKKRVIIELKYVKMAYLYRANSTPLQDADMKINLPGRKRKLLHENSKQMLSLSPYQATNLKYKPFGKNEKELKTLNSLCKDALAQAMGYYNSKKSLVQKKKREDIQTVVGCLVGYGSWVRSMNKKL